jgi:hypothetical protein
MAERLPFKARRPRWRKVLSKVFIEALKARHKEAWGRAPVLQGASPQVRSYEEVER